MSGGERLETGTGARGSGRPVLIADSLADQILRGKKPAGTDKKEGDKPPPPKAATDKGDAPAPTTDGSDIIVKTSYKDISSDPKNTKFDDPIKKTVRYNTIEITDFPDKGVSIMHWKDDDGRYFFWFADKDGKSIDGKNHYYPGNVTKLKIGDRVQDVNAQRKKVDAAIEKKASAGLDLKDGVLTLSVTDADFDKKMSYVKLYDGLKLTDVGKDCKLDFGIDDKGFFFKATDGKAHYFKDNLSKIYLNGQEINVNQERMKAIEKYAKDHGRPFSSMEADRKERTQITIPQDRTVKYLMGLNKMGGDALEVLDKRLTEAVNSKSDDAFFKTWSRWALAQVKTGEVIPMIQRNVLAGKSLNDPEIIDQLNKAIDILDTAKTDSTDQLKKSGKFPQTNVPLMPMDPWGALRDRDDGYFMFWGGCYDQTGWLKLQLTLLRDLMKSNILRIPPERPE